MLRAAWVRSFCRRGWLSALDCAAPPRLIRLCNQQIRLCIKIKISFKLSWVNTILADDDGITQAVHSASIRMIGFYLENH